ncbi:MAG TPA: hypothetical protein VK550_00590 [Polyangiaceae bacterium]|nr:hypothetical protein [Polyangiaceae bacterium]
MGRDQEKAHATQKLMDRVLEQGIKPHAGEIAEIGLSGRFACVVFEPGPAVREALKKWGRSEEKVFPLSSGQVRALAQTDEAARRWFATPPDETKIKVFLVVHDGTLLINHEPGKGYSTEPSSTDRERLS